MDARYKALDRAMAEGRLADLPEATFAEVAIRVHEAAVSGVGQALLAQVLEAADALRHAARTAVDRGDAGEAARLSRTHGRLESCYQILAYALQRTLSPDALAEARSPEVAAAIDAMARGAATEEAVARGTGLHRSVAAVAVRRLERVGLADRRGDGTLFLTPVGVSLRTHDVPEDAPEPAGPGP